jgi:hypothetical protein
MVPRRLPAAVLSLSLVAGSAAVCQGGSASAEARMACCADGPRCPMHESETSESTSHHTLTQTDADRCCVASERDQPRSPGASIPVTITQAVFGPPAPFLWSSPAFALTRAGRRVAHVPPVHRHVLLSVFLV